MASALIVAALAILSRIPRSKATPTTPNEVALERPEASAALCMNYTIPLEVTSENAIFNITPFKNNFDLQDFIFEYVRKDSNVTFHPISGAQNVTASYDIYGTFCTPKNPNGSGREKKVLLATHGLGYDGRYWDSAYKPKEYSFVEAMAKEGFSIFFYDRLGTGRSSIASGYTNQAANQVEIIAALASKLRGGSYTGTIGKPDSLVLVGHSFGSYISTLLVEKYPKLVDAAVLTGVAYAGDNDGKLLVEAFDVRIASSVKPSKYASFDSGYVDFVDINSHFHVFFKGPAYELEVVQYADTLTAPLAVAEYFSTGLKQIQAPEFEGAILVTTGEFDLAACAGECYSSFAKQPLKDIFSTSKHIEAFVQPGAGHGVNFATNATGFYQGISDFLGRAGF